MAGMRRPLLGVGVVGVLLALAAIASFAWVLGVDSLLTVAVPTFCFLALSFLLLGVAGASIRAGATATLVRSMNLQLAALLLMLVQLLGVVGLVLLSAIFLMPLLP